MKLHKFIATLTIALIIVLATAIWFFPSNDDFRTENPFWNGIRDISSIIPASPLDSLSELPPSPQGVTLVLIPYLDFSPAELEELNSFVTQGGTVILADDYGYGNQILEYLGLKARFSGQPLLDPLSNYKNKWFPQIPHLAGSPITLDAERLVLNHATSLTGVETSDALALSSVFSFLDLNGNQTWEEDEPTGPLPVISSHNLDKGQIILIADPSIFINSMQTMESNYNFIQNIGAITTTSLLIDQSHLPPSNLQQTKGLLSYIRASLTTPLGTLGLVILALTITLMPLWRERRGH
ncbi:MAG: DUF4350 domain-containing protein [Dehalococcoidales bacterium]